MAGPSSQQGGDRDDLPLYLVAVVALVIGGALVRTFLLNWISGPVFVVAVVGGLGALRDRRRARREAASDAAPTATTAAGTSGVGG